MKATFVLAVVAALVAVACGAPGSHAAPKWNPKVIKTAFNSIKAATSDPVIDWTRAAALAADIRKLLSTTTTTVANLAYESDPAYGSEIAYIAFREHKLIDTVLKTMEEDIKEQTLNGGQVVLYMGEVTFRFVTSALEIEPLLNNIGEDAAWKISEKYDETMESLDKLVVEFFELYEIDSAKKMF